MELALVLIFLLIPLLVGVADIARAYFEHLAVVNAANVAARWATLSGREQYCSGYGSVQTVVAGNLGDVPVQILSVSAVAVGTPGPMVQVSVTYAHTLFFGVIDSSLNLTGASMMPGTLSTPVACLSCCPTPVGTPVPTSTTTPTRSPTATSSPTPTVTPTPSSTNTPTRTPTSTPTWTPTSTPTATPTSTPTGTATQTPVGTPTATPTLGPLSRGGVWYGATEPPAAGDACGVRACGYVEGSGG